MTISEDKVHVGEDFIDVGSFVDKLFILLTEIRDELRERNKHLPRPAQPEKDNER